MNICDILNRYRGGILKEWARMLHTEVSPHYSARPIKELERTITLAFDAYRTALVENDYSKIDRTIEDISQLRFQSGFALSEVQKAFELFRFIVIPIIAREMAESTPEMIATLNHLNICLSYSIHRFSDFFQALSEREIRGYAQMLEIKVEDRTRELAESEAKYRTLVEEIRDGYFVNMNGKIVFANKAFGTMHGYNLSEVVNRPFTDFIAPESLEEVSRIYEQRVQEKKSRDHYVYNRLHKDGSKLPTENKVVMTLYGGRKAAIGICRDITERVEIEKRVREAENFASIGQITTALAHEIRNPLSSAKMGIQMILKNPAFKGNEKRRLEILAQEVTRLNRIVTEMLDFAKPMKFDFQPASMEDLVNSSLDVIEMKIKEKGIIITKVFGKKLPPVIMDTEKMEQAVLNLLLNAIEAVDIEGMVNIIIRQQRGKGGMIRTEIVDNGTGISGEDLRHIFDPFYSKKTKGTGLGLANAKRIVEAHGGSIQILPAITGGVRATLTLPTVDRSGRTRKTGKGGK